MFFCDQRNRDIEQRLRFLFGGIFMWFSIFGNCSCFRKLTICPNLNSNSNEMRSFGSVKMLLCVTITSLQMISFTWTIPLATAQTQQSTLLFEWFNTPNRMGAQLRIYDPLTKWKHFHPNISSENKHWKMSWMPFLFLSNAQLWHLSLIYLSYSSVCDVAFRQSWLLKPPTWSLSTDCFYIPNPTNQKKKQQQQKL